MLAPEEAGGQGGCGGLGEELRKSIKLHEQVSSHRSTLPLSTVRHVFNVDQSRSVITAPASPPTTLLAPRSSHGTEVAHGARKQLRSA
eukprot:1741134-Rhodomonas_salina.5